MTLTREGFEKLLATLDPDPGRAGERYELIRRKLVRFFEWHQCGPADDKADEVFDRVGRRLQEGEVIRAADPASYFYGVARNVLHEHWDALKREQRALQAAGAIPESAEGFAEQPSDSENAHECLQSCLSKLSSERRRLILGYYQGEKETKILGRQGLADRLQIPPNALRLRAFRIRETLERCVRTCLETRRAAGDPARGRNESRTFPTRSVERGSP